MHSTSQPFGLAVRRLKSCPFSCGESINQEHIVDYSNIIHPGHTIDHTLIQAGMAEKLV